MDITDFDDQELFSFFDVDNDDLFCDLEDLILPTNSSNTSPPISNSEFLSNQTSSTSTQKKAAVSSSSTGGGDVRNVNNPKILISKHDVRRDYAKKFADAFNACDVKIILKFLEDYCIKDCILIQQCIGKENPFIPKYIEVFGIHAILEFWRTLFMTVPDALMVMLETKLRVKHVSPQVIPLSAAVAGASCTMTSAGDKSNSSSNSSSRPAGVNQPLNSSMSSSDRLAIDSTPSVEISCIVSSFSFTGTKLYQLTAQNAVFSPPPGSSGSQSQVKADVPPNHFQMTTTTTAATSAAATATNSSSSSSGSNNDVLSDTRELERRLFPPVAPTVPTLRYTDAIAVATAEAATAAANGTAMPSATGKKGKKRGHENSATELLRELAAKYNPQGTMSIAANSLAGGGGSKGGVSGHPSGITHRIVSSNPHNPKEKSSNYMMINSNTKLSAGDLILPANSHLDFLGTLNMFVDANMKIIKIEFLYSTTD